MKKSINKTALTSVIIVLSLFVGSTMLFTACTNGFGSNKTIVNGVEIPALIARKGVLATAAEWTKTQEKVTELTAKIVAQPTDIKPRLQLATIFMSEARITGDSYYNQATLKVLDGVLGIEPKNFEATTYRASMAMSLHQFETARSLATAAKAINPDNAYVYGVLVDANVEQGNYAEAIAMSDKMQVLKPSLESYARASYLREIYGDYPGAIDAMTLAVKAGLPGSESAAWSQTILADLYLNAGDLAKAKENYDAVLAVRANFPNAVIGQAKLAKAQGDYVTAIKRTEDAIKIASEASYISLLGELYALSGDAAKATKINTDVVRLLEAAEKEQQSSEIVMAHNAKRELAMDYLAVKDYNKALTFAKQDLALRPNNIDANELVAWVLYSKGDKAAAAPFAEKMLATGSKNPEKLNKARLIMAAR